MIALTELYWIAGFLEGEGCFNLSSTQIRATASQKQLEPLERLQKTLGGKMYRRKHQSIWEWWLSGPAAAGLMMTVYLLLSTRRRHQVRVALAAWRRRPLWNRWRTACLHGHAYTPANTRRWSRKPNTRICRVCAAAADKRHRAKLTA